MKISNRVTNLFKIQYPIIQAGMVWVSGNKLAAAVSNNGGLGLIGAGSMKPDLLAEHITKCKAATTKPFGVNIPLLRGDADQLVKTVIENGVKIAFTAAGHPGKFIDELKKNDITVCHVVSSLKFAKKAESVGCDAVVAEGIEAGGHDGADELSVFTLTQQLVEELKIPVISAGGITNGKAILSLMTLGAEGVQIGTRFAVTQESSAHENYKQRVVDAIDNDTVLILKKIGMVRLLKNKFTEDVIAAESIGADIDQLRNILGQKRERLGIFEGDAELGMMEAGQGVGLIKDVPTVKELMERLVNEYDEAYKILTAQ